MVKLAEVFQDHMILQRRKDVKIWGESEKKQTIKVIVKRDSHIFTQSEQRISEGYFEVFLPAMEAMEDVQIDVICDEKRCCRFENVDIGEVWIAGGQSNMEFQLQCDCQGEHMISEAEDAHFRYYELGKYAFEEEREERIKDDSFWNQWKSYTRENAPCFSAVSVYFARYLRRKLGIPVGIISCNWGGTKASAWMDYKRLEVDSKLSFYTDQYQKSIENIDLRKYIERNRQMRRQTANPKVQANQLKVMKNENQKKPGRLMLAMAEIYAKGQASGPHDENRPGGLYETMLSKIKCYSCAGVIWYQGESDVDYSELYAHMFTELIHNWRAEWKEVLPFLFVQIAPFEAWMACTGEKFPVIRQQQQQVADQVEKTWMASIMDIGSRYDIHPKNKQPVGERLGKLAVSKVYGLKVQADAPEVSKVEKYSGKIVVTFVNSADGLQCQDDCSSLFQIKIRDRLISAKASVCRDKVILESNEIKEDDEIKVSFAYMPYLEMNLYNSEILPAKPFEWRTAE